jgi:S-layer protein (TIGR01567 family)
MKKMTAIMLTSMAVLLATAMVVGAVDQVDVRGQVANLGNPTASWDNSTFAGFYYDIDKNIGNEKITFTLSNANPASATLADTPDANGVRGIVYTAEAQPKNFKFKPWGQYQVIGFMADRYFAAYDTVVTKRMAEVNETLAFLADKSKNDNLMTNEQISKVLMDTDTEMTITSGTPLKLAEGYELAVKSIDTDGNKVFVELTKNGASVDTKVVQPSVNNAEMSDKTYYYKMDLGDTKEIVTIAVHFKNAFRGTDNNIATVDGVFQVSDVATALKSDVQYDKMSIRSVNPTAMTILMDNKDNQVTLSKNKDTVLMQNIYIKTADQDPIDATNPLRYYIYKKYTEPGTYEMRSTVGNLGQATISWDNSTFAGLYYDIDKNLGAEKLTFTISNANPASATLADTPDANGVRGIVYTTQSQPKNFKFKPWGQYQVIGFLAERYFAKFDEVITAKMVETNEPLAFLADKSKNDNLMTNEQISKVLMDTDTEMTITTGTPLKLAEGYELAIKSIDEKGNKAFVELMKNGASVDTKVVQPSIDNAKMGDKTYYYKRDLGDTKEIVTIAVHFKNAFRGTDMDIATVDGVFQVSDTPTALKSDVQYDKMSIRSVNPTAMTILMDNKDNQVTLSKNKDTTLMMNIHIKTADQDDIDATNPLRFYIYKSATIEGANVTTEAPKAEAKTNVTTEAPKTEAPKTEAKANVTTEAAKTEAPKTEEKKAENATAKPESKGMPGFEAVFAVAGLLAVAYLVRRD